MTIPTIKTNTNTDIRTKTTAGSITRANVADLFDALADEILARGIKGVADTTALSALTGTDNKNAIVADNGIWQYASSGTPNGTTIFAASGGGVWVRIFANQDITGKQDTLVSGTNLKTINSTSLLGSGNINTATDISGKQDTLISGTNLKTINSMSLLGSGNIDIVTSDEIEEYANLAAFPGTGDTNILYVAIDTEYLYRWSGSAYVQVGGGSAGSQTLDQVLTEGNTTGQNINFTHNYSTGAGVHVHTLNPLIPDEEDHVVVLKTIQSSEYGVHANVGKWVERFGEYEVNADGRKNVVWGWGYNIDQGNNNDGYIRFGIESHFNAGSYVFEWHAPEVKTADGAINRWYSIIGNKATPSGVAHLLRGNTFSFTNITTGVSNFAFDGANWGIFGDNIYIGSKAYSNEPRISINTETVDTYLTLTSHSGGSNYLNVSGSPLYSNMTALIWSNLVNAYYGSSFRFYETGGVGYLMPQADLTLNLGYDGSSRINNAFVKTGYFNELNTQSMSGDPTSTEIASGKWMVWKNTTSGDLKLWANDGGTLKSVTLT